MLSLLDILAITGPVTLVALIGFGAVKTNRFPTDGIAPLIRLMMNFVLPSALFISVIRQDVGSIFNIDYFLTYGGVTLAMMIGTIALYHLWFKRSFAHGAMAALGTSSSNGMMIGLPIFIVMFGEHGVIGIILLVLVQDLVLMPAMFTLAEFDHAKGSNTKQAIINGLKGVVRNPIVGSIVAGAVLAVLGVNIPDPLLRPLELLAAATAGGGLFLIGAMLANTGLRGVQSKAILITVLKLIIHPALIFGAFALLPDVDAQIKIMAVIVAAIPMIGLYPAFAQKYGDAPEAPAAALLATSVSFVTLSLWIWAAFWWF